MCALFSEIFTSSFILRRYLCDAWCKPRENRRESCRTDFVAVLVKQKSNRTESYFLEIVYLDLYPDKVWGFSIFSFCTPPGDIWGRPLITVDRSQPLRPDSYKGEPHKCINGFIYICRMPSRHSIFNFLFVYENNDNRSRDANIRHLTVV